VSTNYKKARKLTKLVNTYLVVERSKQPWIYCGKPLENGKGYIRSVRYLRFCLPDNPGLSGRVPTVWPVENKSACWLRRASSATGELVQQGLSHEHLGFPRSIFKSGFVSYSFEIFYRAAAHFMQRCRFKMEDHIFRECSIYLLLYVWQASEAIWYIRTVTTRSVSVTSNRSLLNTALLKSLACQMR
jgi:hypothetical protein